jgi:acyl-CoA-binding protein
MVAQTAEFKKAIEDSRKLKAKPSDDELLQVPMAASTKARGNHVD